MKVWHEILRQPTARPHAVAMTDRGDPPRTLAARLVVAGLALAALLVGAFWMWSTSRGAMVAGVPSWVPGLVVVGLLVALAVAVDRVRNSAP